MDGHILFRWIGSAPHEAAGRFRCLCGFRGMRRFLGALLRRARPDSQDQLIIAQHDQTGTVTPISFNTLPDIDVHAPAFSITVETSESTKPDRRCSEAEINVQADALFFHREFARRSRCSSGVTFLLPAFCLWRAGAPSDARQYRYHADIRKHALACPRLVCQERLRYSES